MELWLWLEWMDDMMMFEDVLEDIRSAYVAVYVSFTAIE